MRLARRFRPVGRLRVLALICIVIAAALPAVGQGAQDVKTAMQSLKAKAAQLGPPAIHGEESLAGKTVPILWFGSTKMNGNFAFVDAIQKEQGGVQTLFVKSGDNYVRVATNVKKKDGSRGVGTLLDPSGKVIVNIRKGESYYGDADVLGKTYATGYEPIRDAKGQVVGIYFVGYSKT